MNFYSSWIHLEHHTDLTEINSEMNLDEKECYVCEYYMINSYKYEEYDR